MGYLDNMSYKEGENTQNQYNEKSKAIVDGYYICLFYEQLMIVHLDWVLQLSNYVTVSQESTHYVVLTARMFINLINDEG
ncbi:unnamed protein product (macronuclear) [Paramecium tetraurelia]|uniref:Uncharacterized protein n=1 Tax=Paramecium tetraurelia TaxID=5888 RepID=A0CHH6_PARTE|nr:uncharacterized protein GSPATT00038345001 [Paramecium tetraurelia]CAK70243.1 unnamed protein product [Paramecium tetraurelia]|eukprot:XP_001437640.1 hypothetical protein (macronuclear) [Paramecium tetraurelia strain d4-2]